MKRQKADGSDDDEEEEEEQEKKKEFTRIKQTNKQLAAQLKAEKRLARTLRDDIESFRAGNNSHRLYLESVRVRRMSLWWFVCVTAAFLCAVGAFHRQRLTLAALDFAAFLLVWRGLYVDQNRGPMVVALMAVGCTLAWG